MSGWNASGGGCCQGCWEGKAATIRHGIWYTKPLRVGQVLPVRSDPALPFVQAHCLSCSWKTGVDTYHPNLSECRSAICFPSCICTSVFDLLSPSHSLLEIYRAPHGRGGGGPYLTHKASLLHSFIMCFFVSEVRVSMSVFLIKSVIDET